MVVCLCNPSYSGGRGRRILVKSGLGKNMSPSLEKKLKAKELGMWIK
jgi:hypothetical protein